MGYTHTILRKVTSIIDIIKLFEFNVFIIYTYKNEKKEQLCEQYISSKKEIRIDSIALLKYPKILVP